MNKKIPFIVAHRGASADAPENTLEAFELAWQLGADAIEGDFHMTLDGHIICHHDPMISMVDGRLQAINEMALKDLLNPAGNQTIPTLSQVLDTVPQGKGIYIEVKCGPEITDNLLDVVSRSGQTIERVTVISFNQDVIAGIKQRMPAMRAHWLVDFKGSVLKLKPDAASIIGTLHRVRADGVGVKADPRISKSFVSSIHSAGFEVNAWTIDAKALARHFIGAGVDAITTNRPGIMRTFLNRFNNTD